MKKALLLLLLVPFFALSQSTLVRWRGYQGSNAATSYYSSYFTGGTIAATGASLNIDYWNGFQTYNWPTANQPSDYVQITATSATGYAATLSTLNFQFNANSDGASKLTIKYALTADFANPVTVLDDFVLPTGVDTAKSVSLSNVVVGSAKTIYIRIYGYKRNNGSWSGGILAFKHVDGNNTVGSGSYAEGIELNGSIASVSGTGGPVLGTSPLNGTYVIGAASESTYQKFNTITAAVTYLNSYGISGPVTFLLKDATYTNSTETFPFTINAIANSSATNTVTFKPYSNINPKIEATNTTFSTGVPAIFYLNGADYITFDGSNVSGGTTRNLTLNNKDAVDYVDRSVIWVASNGNNPATNITVKNCNIKQSNPNQGGKFNAGIYSGNNGIGGNNTINVAAASSANSYLTITNNDFTSVKQGVYINGGTNSNAATNITVKGNDLGATTTAETIICPATFSNVDTFTYTENYVNNLLRTTDDGNLVSAGIYVTGSSQNGTITKNIIKDLTRTTTNNQVFGGIVLSSTKTNSNILVANNFVSNVACQGNGGGYLNGYGIVIDNGGQYKIYHNTVSLATNQPQGGFSAAFYVGVNAGNGHDVRNNIFVNKQTNTATRRTAITVVKTANNINSTFSFLDNNNYYSTDRIGYVAQTNGVGNVDWAGNGIPGDSSDNSDYKYTLAQWQSTTGKDAATKNINPVFASTSDLHIDANSAFNNDINNTATPLTAVAKDIDGQIRSTTTPDMGADEFGAIVFPTPGSTAGVYCDSSTTWNGSSWSNGTPTAEKDAIFNGAFTQNGGNFYACSIYVLNGAVVSFSGNSEVTVTHSVNIQNSGSFTMESGSNLIQVENDQNTGTATIKRAGGLLKRLDYTMWCAPVVDSRSAGFQTLRQFSPVTSNGRFYEFTTSLNGYTPLPELTTKFELGKGLLIRMPNSDATPGYNAGTARIIFTGSFIGTPNNGTIRKPLEYYSDSQAYNFVGNPYSSPLCVTDFINANLDSTTGTLWIWRKTNDMTQLTYSTVNLGGYTANSAPGGNTTDGNTLIQDPYTITTKGSLNTAQGFIVKATGTNKQLVYTNSMRIQTHSTSFFKSAATAETTEGEVAQFDRVWLNVTNADNLFAQTLIGYNEVSTLGQDNGYDSETLTQGQLNLYTVMHTANDTLALTIQTRGAFDIADQVALGYSAATAGTYTISIDHADGAFANGQKVYIKDNAEGITRELTAYNYTFTTEAGQFDDRFTVMYTNAPQTELGTEPVLEVTKAVMVYNSNGQVKVVAPENIKSVTVYDITGKQLYQNSAVNNVEFASSALNVSQQVVIVNVTLENQKVVTKKLMMF